MARTLLLLILFFSLIAARAQQSGDLRIEIFLLAGQQTNTTRVAVRFTNLTSHELDLPTDNVFTEGVPVPPSTSRGLYYPQSIFSCAALPGSISFRYAFTAQNAETITKCGEQGAVPLTGRAPDVLQRATSWTHLKPGASTTREAKMDWVLPIQAGIFRNVSAIYRSPKFSSAERAKLKQANICVPTGDYISANSFSFRTDGQSVTLFEAAEPPRAFSPLV